MAKKSHTKRLLRKISHKDSDYKKGESRGPKIPFLYCLFGLIANEAYFLGNY